MDAVEAHLGYVTEHALDEYGPKQTHLWLAHIDTRTSRLPTPPSPQQGDQPTTAHDLATSNLYLDQPTLLAALELGRRTGCKCYGDAVELYLQSYLNQLPDTDKRRFLISPNDDYHVMLDRFHPAASAPLAVGIYTPAWEILWRRAAEATERTIRSQASDWLASHAAPMSQAEPANELAQRAIALDSLSWLIAHRETNDPALPPMLQQLATAPRRLPPSSNITALESPSMGVLGSWIESLVRASRSTGNSHWIERAQAAANQQLAIGHRTSGEATTALRQRIQPSAFNAQSSAQSPLPWAEACFSLWEETGGEAYREEAVNWADALRDGLAAGPIRLTRAEDYGRAIHLLLRTADALGEMSYREAADQLAEQAMTDLYEPKWGMFRSRLGIDRCDAADGPGFLLLALLALTGPDPTADSALHF